VAVSLNQLAQTRLLIVGGAPDLLAFLAQQFKCSGCPVLVEPDTQQALEVLHKRVFDLLLLGIDVPSSPDSSTGKPTSLDPLEMLRRLKSDPALQGLPVVLFADGNGLSMARLADGLALGADDYYCGPWPTRGGAESVISSSASRASNVEALLLEARLNFVLSRKAQDHLKEELHNSQQLAHDLVNVILPLGLALSAEKDFNRLLERILLEARALCNADAGTLYLRTEDNHLRFAMVYTHSLNIALGGTTGREPPFAPMPMYDPATGQPNYHNAASHVALEGHSINIPDIYSATEFDFSGTRAFDRQNNYRTISSLTVPLKDHDDRVVGVLQLLNAKDPQTGQVVPFSAYLERVTELLASLAAVALVYQILIERQKKLSKFEQEMEIARKIQIDFLPAQIPQPPGWEITATFRPARQVGGDFFDVFYLPSGHLCFIIADVCDKGAGAAMFMALIRSLLRAFSELSPIYGAASNLNLVPASHSSAAAPLRVTGHESPAPAASPQLTSLLKDLTVLNTIVLTNNYLIQNHGQTNMFATLFLGVLDLASGKLSYINAGHNFPYLMGLQDSDAPVVKERLKSTGPAVGMLPDANYFIQHTQMAPGDFVYLFTDGVSEARSPSRELFNEKRLLPLLEEPFASLDELVARVDAHLAHHIDTAEQSDDITMLAVRRSIAAG
jgi:sigma-B regulation protein RsbU (phosphoserine phosphatase)